SAGAAAMEQARFPLRMAGKQLAALVAGTVHFEQRDLLPDKDVVFMQCAPAAQLIFPKRPDCVSQINVILKPGGDRDGVRRQPQQLVGETLKIQTVQATNELQQDVTAGLELAFAVGGVGALVIGLFLVYNVLSVTVAERRHEIGILRSVGATRNQI